MGEFTRDIRYQRNGDYYIPVLKLPEEKRSIGRWGRLHRDYLKEHIVQSCLSQWGGLFCGIHKVSL